MALGTITDIAQAAHSRGAERMLSVHLAHSCDGRRRRAAGVPQPRVGARAVGAPPKNSQGVSSHGETVYVLKCRTLWSILAFLLLCVLVAIVCKSKVWDLLIAFALYHAALLHGAVHFTAPNSNHILLQHHHVSFFVPARAKMAPHSCFPFAAILVYF